MSYEFTYTPRFKKHFKNLSAQEKKRLKSKMELLSETPYIPPCALNASREPLICMNAA